MTDYNDTFEQVRVINDATDGLIQVSPLVRHGQQRKTKLKNNFTGLLTAADSGMLLKICQLLAGKLPAKESDETIVGMYKSGIIMCGYLALARSSTFNWTTPDKLGDFESAIHFAEDHHADKNHYLYGIKSGDSVIVIEDEVTSGKGISQLIICLKAAGAQVRAVACAIETINFGGRERIKAEAGLDLVSLVQVELQI